MPLSLQPIPADDPRTARYLAGQAPDPRIAAPALTPPPDEGGALGTLGDVAAGLVAGGVPQAVNESLDFGGMLVNGLTGNGFRESEGDEKLFRLPEYEPSTQAGKAAKEIGAFAAGMFAGGKFLKAARLLQGTGKMASLGRGLAQGALSDFLTRDPHEERLSNLLEEFPALSNPVTAFLAADPDDHAAVGRLKNALEGMGLGVAFDSLVKGLGALKKLRAASTPDGELRVLRDVAEQSAPERAPAPRPVESPIEPAPTEARLDVDLGVELRDDGVGIEASPRYAEGPITQQGAAPEPARPQSARREPSGEETGAAKETPPAEPVPLPDEITGPRPPGMDDATWRAYAEAMRGIVDIATSPDGAVPLGTNITALRRAFADDAAGSKVLERLSAVIRDQTARAQGSQPLDWWKSNAEDLINTFGAESFARFAEVADHNPHLIEALGVYNHAAKMVQTYIVEDAVALTDKLVTGTATALDRLRFVEAGKKSAGLQKSIEDTATAVGRLLKSHDADLALDDELRATLRWMLDKDLPQSEDEARALLDAMGVTDDGLLAEVMDVVDTASKGARRDKAVILQALELLGQRQGEGWGRFALDALNEYRINALLGSPVTWVVNVAGPLVKSAIATPVEQMIGGLISRDLRQVRLGYRTMAGMAHTLGDSIGAASKLLKKGCRDAPMLDAALSSKTEAHSAVLTYERLRRQILKDRPEGSLDPWQETLCRSLGWIGSVTRAPSRVMLISDELLKQMNYRSSLYAKFTEEALDSGLKGEAATGFVQKRLAACFDETGRALDGALWNWPGAIPGASSCSGAPCPAPFRT